MLSSDECYFRYINGYVINNCRKIVLLICSLKNFLNVVHISLVLKYIPSK